MLFFNYRINSVTKQGIHSFQDVFPPFLHYFQADYFCFAFVCKS
jgi:hypothetical protein